MNNTEKRSKKMIKYPPMGWNSWDCYGVAVTEEIVRKMLSIWQRS